MKQMLKILVFFVALFVAGQAQAVSLSIQPGAQTVSLGGTASVDLMISGLGDFAVGGFDLNLSIDSSILSLSDIAFGTGLGFSDQAFIMFPAGGVNLFELSYESPDDLVAFQSDSFSLATLTFDAIAVGVSELLLDSVLLSDQDGFALAIDPVLTGFVSVEEAGAAPVPEPGTLILLGSGLSGMFFARRKKQ